MLCVCMYHGLDLEQSKFPVMEMHGPHVFMKWQCFGSRRRYTVGIREDDFLSCDFIDTNVNSFVVPLASFSSAEV